MQIKTLKYYYTTIFISSIIALSNVSAAQVPALNGRTNLALGKQVHFAVSKIHYKKGQDYTKLLTDGKISTLKNHKIWLDPESISWNFTGRTSLSLDLGKIC